MKIALILCGLWLGFLLMVAYTDENDESTPYGVQLTCECLSVDEYSSAADGQVEYLCEVTHTEEEWP